MRDIKFRAWNKKLKQFSPEYASFHFGEESAVIFDVFNGNFDTVVWDMADCDILQFTGLKDKNGVDIYEGYIVNAYHYEFEIFEKGRVEFSDGRFSIGKYWKDGIHDWYSMEQYTQSDLEVIGNFYENKELLEKEK